MTAQIIQFRPRPRYPVNPLAEVASFQITVALAMFTAALAFMLAAAGDRR